MLPTAVYAVDLPGHGIVHYDPLAVRRGLLVATSGRCWEWAQQAAEFDRLLAALDAEPPTDPEVGAARRAEWGTRLAELEGKLAPAAFSAFGLAGVDPDTGTGVTEAVALAVLQDYLAWMEEKKSAPDPSPT